MTWQETNQRECAAMQSLLLHRFRARSETRILQSLRNSTVPPSVSVNIAERNEWGRLPLLVPGYDVQPATTVDRSASRGVR